MQCDSHAMKTSAKIAICMAKLNRMELSKLFSRINASFGGSYGYTPDTWKIRITRASLGISKNSATRDTKNSKVYGT